MNTQYHLSIYIFICIFIYLFSRDLQSKKRQLQTDILFYIFLHYFRQYTAKGYYIYIDNLSQHY